MFVLGFPLLSWPNLVNSKIVNNYIYWCQLVNNQTIVNNFALTKKVIIDNIYLVQQARVSELPS